MGNNEILVWVQVIGLFVLVASVVLLLLQTRELKKATRASVYQNIASTMLEIDRAFVAQPDLRKYFYDGVKIKEKDPDFPASFSIAEMILDFMDNVLTQKTSLPEYPWHTWIRYFKYLRDSSLVLRLFYDKYKDMYPDTLKTIFSTDEIAVSRVTRMWPRLRFWAEFSARFVLWVSAVTFAILTVLGVLPILPEPTSLGLLAWLYLFMLAALMGWFFDIRRLFT